MSEQQPPPDSWDERLIGWLFWNSSRIGFGALFAVLVVCIVIFSSLLMGTIKDGQIERQRRAAQCPVNTIYDWVKDACLPGVRPWGEK